jgi:hypothetical protein
MLNGSTGAIGSAALQLLKQLEVNVTAVCPGRHVDLVLGLGADRVIDYSKEDFTQDGQVDDTVLDAVGKNLFGRCKGLLKPGGTYVSTDLGPWSMNPILALVTPPFGGRKVRFPIPIKATQEGLLRIKAMIESGAFKPLVDRVYPLDQIVEAYRYVETEQIGAAWLSASSLPPGRREGFSCRANIRLDSSWARGIHHGQRSGGGSQPWGRVWQGDARSAWKEGGLTRAVLSRSIRVGPNRRSFY